MGSEPKGYIRVPVWVDDGVVKPLVNDDGRIPVLLDLSSVTLDVNIESSDINVPVTESSPLTSLQSQLYGWDLNNWHKNPLVWGCTDRWQDAESFTMLTDTYYAKNTVAVPAGYVYVLNVAAISNSTALRGFAYIALIVSAVNYIVAYHSGLAQYEALTFRCPVVMKQGDQLRFYMDSCITDDLVNSLAWGYMMKVNE